MFSFLGGSSSLLAARQDPTQERPAPPYPTPISFPSIPFLPEHPAKWTPDTVPDLFQAYSRIRKLSDVSAAHLTLLNPSLQSVNSVHDKDSTELEYLFPSQESAEVFLPPKHWAETPGTANTSAHPEQARVLANGRPYPSQQDFLARWREVACKNEDAYAALTRSAHANGQQPAVRLAHYRRFWEALSNTAGYWDTSRDEYFPEKYAPRSPEKADAGAEDDVADGEKKDDEPRKKVKRNPEQDDMNRDFDLPLGTPPPSGRPPPDVRPPQLPHEPTRPPGTYRGYRMSNGAGMPESYRVDTTRAFVEPIAWAFGFSLAGHRRPPIVEIKSLLVPIKLTGTVWRPPTQRDKARAGHLEGPVMGISCRSDTGFDDGKADPVLDVLRELGALLCIAQERAREGQVERKPGEGKWWTSVPRWGGGPGGEMGEAITSIKDDETGGEDTEKDKDKVSLDVEAIARGRPSGRTSAAKRKAALANAWRTLRVGVGFWDPRTEYKAVGKPADSDWDEVYLVSSLNHHISIVKLQVHKHYLHFLRTGEYIDDDACAEWYSPIMSRSRWYDLFSLDERLEAFRLIWGVMGYLARSD